VKLVVANPENCVVFCRACAKTCGPDALSFPDKPEIVALIKKLHAEETASAGGGRAAPHPPPGPVEVHRL
jgi:ferredoxin